MAVRTPVAELKAEYTEYEADIQVERDAKRLVSLHSWASIVAMLVYCASNDDEWLRRSRQHDAEARRLMEASNE